MQPHRLYDYLVAARQRLFDWIRPLTREQYEREFPIGMKTIHATLAHVASAEWAYGRRLQGHPAAISESPYLPEKVPSFADLEAAWTRMAGETRALLTEITDGDAPVEYRVHAQGPGGPAVRITTTRAGLASQLVLHEVHHRAQVMTMLREMGVAAQNLDYSTLMFDRRPEPE